MGGAARNSRRRDRAAPQKVELPPLALLLNVHLKRWRRSGDEFRAPVDDEPGDTEVNAGDIALFVLPTSGSTY